MNGREPDPIFGCLRRGATLLAAILLAACSNGPEPLPGTLEWDRIALPAEVSEPVLSLAVREGDTVQAGQILAVLDPGRMDASIGRLQAELAQARAQLDEALHGARPETLDAAHARQAETAAAQREAQQQYERIVALRASAMASPAELDRARATRDRARAATRVATAQLRELTRGTRAEQVALARATLARAQAQLSERELTRARLTLRAPRAGRVDALPFKPGDQPPIGATVVSLLVGEAPYARVYVPATRRAGLREGARFRVQVQGVAEAFTARLRSIASEASFTPYFALAGDDASRLVYRSELVLDGPEARELPAGLMVQAEPLADDHRD
ncbi:HlyD family secretion protein [Immundisolibacter sp.]|uniref:HlyD family secretion protein n=1 Tax=Immundisolibacter sp. TaxID=1934948 RepID=UPI0035658899